VTSSAAAIESLPDISIRFRPLVRRVIGILGALLLFTVKFNLVSFAGESAGLRIDDALIFAIGALLFVGWLVRWRTGLAPVEKCFAGMLLVFLVSNAWNLGVYHQSSPLYSARMCEYFLFFYFGLYFAEFYRLAPLVATWLGFNGMVMLLQAAHLVGAFASEGYKPDAGRAMGITGGPWEVGAMINFCFAILLAEYRLSTRKVLMLFAATFVLVLLTGARMPALAHIVLLLLYFGRHSRNPLHFVLKIFVPLGLVLAVLVLVPNPVAARSSKLLSAENVRLVADAYGSLPVPDHFVELPPLPAVSGDVDLSWLVRSIKWVYVAKLWASQPVAWFIGLGPGTVGIALDGGWLRLLVEEGLLGVAAFLALFAAIGRLDRAMRDVALGLFISMLMIDIHIAYKAMSFIFFMAGCYYYRRRQSLASQGV
jgi:hypothetical protein